jgi:alginate O-acetyltransferase complex protein AlgI
MRPLRSFLLLLIFLVCFIGLHYLVHPNHLFPSVNEFVPPEILNIFRSDQNVPVQESPTDTLIIPSVDRISLSVPEKSDQPLSGFLDSVKFSKGQVRVIYYGDSQIEGDRITSYLRHSLRKEIGGTGPGLFLPIMPVMYTKSLWLHSSSNWKRYNYLSYKLGDLSHRELGPFMAICRYLPDGVTAKVPQTAYIRIRPSNFADSASAEYNVLRVFYGNVKGYVSIRITGDEKEISKDTLSLSNGFNEIKCRLNSEKDIQLTFEGMVSPDIYGISIESEKGVIVDNIPQRGSAGLEFTMVDSANLKKAFKKLSPDLIILHYGLNIVKNVRNDYSYYEKGLIRQLELLKTVTPATPILVVGVGDMAINEGDSVKSYQNIPSIIEAQRRATVVSDETFWNSYMAMGGRSSIIKWTDRKPPLAQKDYIHFTYPGADTLSKLLVSSLFVRHDSGSSAQATDTVPANVQNPRRIITMVPDETNSGVFSTVMSSLFRYNPHNPFLFTSPAFWVFLLIVLLGYSLVYKKLTIRNFYLFLVSLLFYYKAGGLFLFILIFVTVIDYSCGFLIYNAKSRGSARFYVLLSIVSNLFLLGYFKYTSFIVNSLNSLLGTDFKVFDLLSNLSNSLLGTSFDISYIILPVGISFFTFQSLSYTIDIYRKKMEPVKNIIDFGFYVSFFPHLVAGPIVRASVFIPQIYKEYELSKHEFSHALYMISKGLIKKIVISNFIALNLVDRVFDAPSIYSGFENLLAVYGYGLQIYCDFSGYTDIAIGVALILGFRLPVNFNSPYKSSSISEFWNRWHISLSQWLRDYLYISLGGNRKGKIRTYFNLMITMLLGGLWHGASLRFIIWGGLHGLGLVINKMWSSVFKNPSRLKWLGRVLGIFITFQFVNFCWIFFRAPDMNSVGIMFRQIFENFSPGSFSTVLPAYGGAVIIILVAYTIHFLPENVKETYRGIFINIPIVAQLVILMLIAMFLYQMKTTEVMPFIYFRF